MKIRLSLGVAAMFCSAVQAELSPREFAETVQVSTYVINPSPLVSMSFDPVDVKKYGKKASTYYVHDFSGPTADNAPNEQYLYSLALWDGLGISKNRDDALLYAMLSLDKGLGAAALICGKAFSGDEDVRVPKDETRAKAYFKQAFEWAQSNAIKGDVLAEYVLAQCYWKGWGVKADISQAIRWWNRAAQSGCVWAVAHLAASFLNGVGIKQDVRLGERLFLVVVSKAGKDSYLLDVAAALMVDDKLSPDVQKAGMSALENAARLRCGIACAWMSELYAYGLNGVREDAKESKRWRAIANELNYHGDQHEQEFARGQQLLASSPQPHHYVKALPWVYRAAKGGHKDAELTVKERQRLASVSQKACDLVVSKEIGEGRQ